MVRSHRAPARLSGSARILLAVVAVLVAGIVVAGTAKHLRAQAGSCSKPTEITVAAAADIAPAVTAIADNWNATHPSVGGACVAAKVVPDHVLEQVTASQGQASSLPTLWIPDSEAPIDQVLSVNSQLLSDAPVAVATTPVVFAAPMTDKSPLADIAHDGAINMKGLGQVIATVCQGSGLNAVAPIEFDDPSTDAATLDATALLSGLVTDPTCLVGTLRSIPVQPDRASLFAAAAAGKTAAVPATEQSVIAYNGGKPAVPLAGLVPDAGGLVLNFPAAIFSGASGEVTSAAEAFRAQLTASTSDQIWWQFGFRTKSGTAGASATASASLTAFASSPPVKVTVLDKATATSTLALWSTSKIAAHVLTLMDTDPSMAQAAAGGTTLMQVETQIATQGLGLFQGTDDMGLWTYGGAASRTSLGYTSVVPIAKLTADQHNVVGHGMTSAKPKGPSKCGLYDAMLAGYAEIQKTYVAGRLNTLIVFTDSTNLCGHSTNDLLAALANLEDANKPILFTVLDVGGTDTKALNGIVSQVGGAVFPVTKSTSIEALFLNAMIKLNQK